jgi:hypothetical protein
MGAGSFGSDDPIRQLKGGILSSHRTGGMKTALLDIGRLIVADIQLL